MKKLIILASMALALVAAVPATASAHWMTKGEAAYAIDDVSPHWYALRPASKWCIRWGAHKVECMVEHARYDCDAWITVTLRGHTRWVGRAHESECY